ncbi:MAG: hypothetical protein P1V97_26530 [Planctomycetota bacterium]|nr:hypothetical protein [Planctomycetota bacterium]
MGYSKEMLAEGFQKGQLEEVEMLSVGGTLLRVVPVCVIVVSLFAMALTPQIGKRRGWPLRDAVETMRELNHAQIYYLERSETYAYGTLDELIASGHVEDKFEDGVNSGYLFEIGFGEDRAHQYWIKATPMESGPEAEYIFTNSTGTIWRSATDFAVKEADCAIGEGFTNLSYGGR